ncbi:hypothetical protein FIBSPDRAFT_864023, partial [Athelia psychrophila]
TELLSIDTLRGEAHVKSRLSWPPMIMSLVMMVYFSSPGAVFIPLQFSAKVAAECQGLARVLTGDVQY